ncbi:MAG: hypothetical protein ACFFCD_12895 [Promethearchaeota archaeon]
MDNIATLAKVIDLNHPVIFPSQFIEIIGNQEKNNAVIIYSPTNDHLIRIFFTNASEVFKVEAKTNGLDHEFLSNLGGFLTAYKITPFYTSGFCKQGPCHYEGYFEKNTIKMSLEEFKIQFSSIKGVSEVKITQFQI